MAKTAHDHRGNWGGGPKVKPFAKESVKDFIEEAPALLKKYLAMHGDWQEVTSHTSSTFAVPADRSTQSWEFKVCACSVCQETEKLVGHPATPNG